MSRPLKLICALVLALALAVIGVTVSAMKWDRDFKRFCAVLSACTAYTQGQYKCHAEGADGDVNVCPENLAFLYRKVAASYPSSRTKSVPENDHFVVHYADGSGGGRGGPPGLFGRLWGWQAHPLFLPDEGGSQPHLRQSGPICQPGGLHLPQQGVDRELKNKKLPPAVPGGGETVEKPLRWVLISPQNL